MPWNSNQSINQSWKFAYTASYRNPSEVSYKCSTEVLLVFCRSVVKSRTSHEQIVAVSSRSLRQKCEAVWSKLHHTNCENCCITIISHSVQSHISNVT